MSRVCVDNLNPQHCYNVLVTSDGHSYGYYQPPQRWAAEAQPVKPQAPVPQEKK